MNQALGLLIVVAILSCIVITVLKGKNWMVVLGLFIHVLWPIAAIRLAKPNSWWARKFYAADKMALAIEREGDRQGDKAKTQPARDTRPVSATQFHVGIHD